MQEQNNNRQQPSESAKQPTGNQQSTQDQRDEMIKNEPDTARIRSERQSVIEGGNKESKEQ
ncbi:MAG: hypothetical protein ACO1NX_04080 [Chitinophagaceae bacterium]